MRRKDGIPETAHWGVIRPDGTGSTRYAGRTQQGIVNVFKLNRNSRAAFRVALPYAFFSGLYIMFSDQAVYLMVDDPALITAIQSVKGWAFVAVSALLIYLLMMQELSRIQSVEAALNEQKSFLNAVLDNSPAVMYLKDRDGRFISANKRFSELFKQDPAGLVGKTDHELFPAEWADVCRKNDLEVLSSQLTANYRETVPHPDGTLHTYLSVKFPVRDSGNQILGVCGISTDITERVMLEERLQRTERLNALGRLTGGIAHDFNNQLTVIAGCLEMLQGMAVSEEERIGLAREAARASSQAASLIERLLSFARNQILLAREVDVNKAIRDMSAPLARCLGDKVTVHYSLMRDCPYAMLDPVQLESAMLNLAINAGDAMPGGGTLTISTRRAELNERDAAADEIAPGAYVQIDVSDTGEGMAPDILARVLEPFFTTKPPGKGTGLGLSMVDGFARQSKGCIRLHSHAGAGTTVSVLLPAISHVNRPVDLPAADDAVQRAGNGETILLVEDEPALLEYTSGILKSHGYQVLTAADAREAMAHMKRYKSIDLLFSDIMLPGGVLGTELAKQFMLKYPGGRVLLSSGNAENWSDDNGSPPPQLLKKPYRSADIIQAVYRTLTGR